MGNKPKAKKIKLTLDEKQKVERIFEPLLSETFGGNNYLRYSLQDAKDTIFEHIHTQLREQNYSDTIINYIARSTTKITNSRNIVKILEIISELCLLEEELSDD